MLYGTNHAFNCAEMRLDAGCILQYIDHLMYSLINRLETSKHTWVCFLSQLHWTVVFVSKQLVCPFVYRSWWTLYWAIVGSIHEPLTSYPVEYSMLNIASTPSALPKLVWIHTHAVCYYVNTYPWHWCRIHYKEYSLRARKMMVTFDCAPWVQDETGTSRNSP